VRHATLVMRTVRPAVGRVRIDLGGRCEAPDASRASGTFLRGTHQGHIGALELTVTDFEALPTGYPEPSSTVTRKM